MWGKPAVPKINAIPSEIADMGSSISFPGNNISILLSCTLTACSNKLLKLKANSLKTKKAKIDAPKINKKALMI